MPARALRALAFFLTASECEARGAGQAGEGRAKQSGEAGAQQPSVARAKRERSECRGACASRCVRYYGCVLVNQRYAVNRYILSLLIVCSLFTGNALSREPVYVAAYDFPPFFSGTLETDVTTELVNLLNDNQNEYEFIIQAIPPNGRYQALSAEGCCDVIFFESLLWGWQNRQIKVAETFPLLRGSERLVAKKIPGRDQSFFDELDGLKLGGVRGYHYLFGGTVMNSEEVAKRYSIYLSDSRITNLRMLIGGRIDAAVLNDELLSALKNSSVNYLEQLLISDRVESEYELGVVVATGKGISVEEVQRLVRLLSRDEKFNHLFARFNLQRFQLYRR